MRIILTNHAHSRAVERDIDILQIRKVIRNGGVVKRIDSDRIVNKLRVNDQKSLEVIYIQEGNRVIVITAYYAN